MKRQRTTVKIIFSNGYAETLAVEAAKGTSIFGETQFAPFAIDHSRISGASSFSIVSGNGIPAEKFAIQDDYFVVPSLSSVQGTVINVTIAVRKGAADSGLSAWATVPTAQPLTLGPKMTSAEMKLRKGPAGTGGFALWQGDADIEQQPTGAVSLRLLRDRKTLDTLFLDGGVAGW